jgi:PAS domain S-box-containing protein
MFIKDTRFRYILVNPAMERELGISTARMLNKTDEELFGEDEGFGAEEVDPRVLAGETIEREVILTLDGHPVTFLDTRVPLRDGRKKAIGICGIARNISDRRREPIPRLAETGSQWESEAMKHAMAMAEMVAQTDTTVLLMGESGSGKDYLARHIHDRSRRNRGSFFTVNCAALSPEIAESELFGHEAGAFTGARRHKKGLVELAEGGSLLFNEVGELSKQLQAKLLSFLDTKSFLRVGGEKSISVNARILAATNRDLGSEVADGTFREDLFHRLNVMAIVVPPLRQRRQDIPRIAQFLVTELAAQLRLPTPPRIDGSCMERIRAYDWPGNVRELKNVLERALILSKGEWLESWALGLDTPEAVSFQPEMRLPPGRSMTEVIDELRIKFVTDALEQTGGNKQQAANLLGISRNALLRLLKSHGIE